MEKVLIVLILAVMSVAIIVGPFVAGAWAERRAIRKRLSEGGPKLPFIQVTALYRDQKHSKAPPKRHDVWLDAEDIQAFWAVSPDEHGENCRIQAGGESWGVEETAGKVALLIEEAEAKAGQQVLAAALQEHARALRAKWE